MKNAAVKKISAVIFAIIMLFTFSANAFAETIQDRLEQELEDLANQYENADPETQVSIQDRFSQLLEDAGLEDIDLGSLAGSDIGSVIGGLGDNLALDGVLGIIGDTFTSGMDMIQDAIGGGNGTADGSNTATTKPSSAGSPNVIVPVTTKPATTNSAETQAPATSVVATAPSTVITNISANLPSSTTAAMTTTEPVTYIPETTTANLVGAGVTTAPQVDLDGVTDLGTDSTTMTVFIVLSVSTLVIITAIIVFFVLKRK